MANLFIDNLLIKITCISGCIANIRKRKSIVRAVVSDP